MDAINEREQLCHLIQQWNENRLDLFNISAPDENNEFHGVMRFYFQEPGEKVATKCIRVSSSATTDAVTDALVQKFHPDMKMLSNAEYSIWEVHENGEERHLAPDEHPLLVQLTWHKARSRFLANGSSDDREGRFLFRRNDQITHKPLSLLQLNDDGSSLKRSTNKRFSKREKKELRKKYQQDLLEAAKQQKDREEEDIARKLYSEVPQTTFTRTISNPEIVMKKRREKKIENKLREMGQGGGLKVYGQELFPNRPYVTILVELNDPADKIVRDALEKYGLDKADPDGFLLAQITLPCSENNLSRSLSDLRSVERRQRFLRDDECPLRCLLSLHPQESERTVFALQRRPANFPPMPRPRLTSTSSAIPTSSTFPPSRIAETMSLSSIPTASGSYHQRSASSQAPTYVTGAANRLPSPPSLVPIGKNGQEVPVNAIPIAPGITEIGSDPAIRGIQLQGPSIHPKHCLLSLVEGGVVTVTPVDHSATVLIGNVPIHNTVTLSDGDALRIGTFAFRFREGTFHRQPSVDYGRASPYAQRIPPSHSYPTELRSQSSLPPKPPTTHFDAYDNSVHSGSNTSAEMLNGPPMLPALLEVNEAQEERFLLYVSTEAPLEHFPHRPTPAFLFYMICRYRIHRDSFPPHRQQIALEREHYMRIFLMKIVERCYHVVHLNHHNTDLLAFWLTNLSEFLNFCKRDHELAVISRGEPRARLEETVGKCYHLLVDSARFSLQSALPTLLSYAMDDSAASRGLLEVLSDTVRLIRRNRLNPALTIQAFSQLFHFINTYIFNWLVSTREGLAHLSRAFGIRLRERLMHVNRWAEQQGLELAAECHMDRIQQAVNLLITPKTIDQIASLGATCYKLNGLQVRYLLENFIVEYNEPPVSQELISHVVALAEQQADVIAMQDGIPIQLEESQHFPLPFLFPEDGYVAESLRGIPPDMSDFIGSLQSQGLCRLLPQIGNNGSWTVHMAVAMAATVGNGRQAVANGGLHHKPSTSADYAQMNGKRSISETNALRRPEIVRVTLQRPPGTGIGLSIVAAQAAGDRNVGIYVKKVVEESPAHRDGRLETGDQLLSVNGQSLVGISQEEAAKKMGTAGSTVNFDVVKHAAMHNGLETWLRNGANANPPHGTGAYGAAFQNGGSPRMPHSAIAGPPTNYMDRQDFGQYRHNRSVSATELYSQADTASLASINSQQQQPYHTMGGAPQRLPSHYRPASRPLVLQPGRPSTSNISPATARRSAVSPTPLYGHVGAPVRVQPQRSASSVPFGSGPAAVSTPFNGYHHPSQMTHEPLTVIRGSPSLTDYHNLPLIEEDPVAHTGDGGSLNSSTSSSGGAASTEHPPQPGMTRFGSKSQAAHASDSRFLPMPSASSRQNSSSSSSPLPPPPSFPAPRTTSNYTSVNETISQERNGLRQPGTTSSSALQARPQQFPASGRRSAPLFEDSVRDVEREATRLLTEEEIQAEEQHRQRRPTEPQQVAVRSQSSTSFGVVRPPVRGEHPPFMAEMESRLVSKRAVHTDVGENGLSKPSTSSRGVETLIDDVSEQVHRLNTTPLTPLDEAPKSAMKMSERSPSPLKPTQQASRRESSSPDDKAKKRVQFADEPKENGHSQASASASSSSIGEKERTQVDVDDSNEPRVQIIGTQEVYNDPRQRRLNEIQAKSLKPVVDGASLGFRDKMKMFAEQLGEQAPRNRFKASSAEREIDT